MRTSLRLALPPLRDLGAHAELPFVLRDRGGRVLRSGALPLDRLAAALPAARVEALLHPEDSVAARVSVPPLRGARLHAAVLGAVEPMVLGDVDALALGHGPRGADGRTEVAWLDRATFLQAWQRLQSHGLRVAAWIPAVWLGGEDAPTRWAPTDPRWTAEAPPWTLADLDLRPRAGASERWQRAAWWSAAAAAVWVLGLNLHAGQREREATQLRTEMNRRLTAAFPDIPVVVDPVRQAAQRRDALRAAQGGLNDGDFLALALAAARAFDFAADRVLRVQYGGGELRITPTAGAALPPPARLAQAGLGFGLAAAASGADWTVRRANDTGPRQGKVPTAAPAAYATGPAAASAAGRPAAPAAAPIPPGARR